MTTEVSAEDREFQALNRAYWVHQRQDRDPWPPHISEHIADAFQAATDAGLIDPDTYLLTRAGESRWRVGMEKFHREREAQKPAAEGR